MPCHIPAILGILLDWDKAKSNVYVFHKQYFMLLYLLRKLEAYDNSYNEANLHTSKEGSSGLDFFIKTGLENSPNCQKHLKQRQSMIVK